MSHTKHLRNDQWGRISGILPGYSDAVERPVKDNRRFVEGVIWIGRNGGHWRFLPPKYGKWSSTHKRFQHWADQGIWKIIFRTLSQDADITWVMIDLTIIRAHQHAEGEKKFQNKFLGRSCRGFSIKIHAA